MNQIKLSDLVLDLKRCWLWQYDKAPYVDFIMRNQEAFFKKYSEQFLSSYIHDIFNLNTANEFGLNVWRKILNTEKLDASFYCQNVALEATDEPGIYNFLLASPDNSFRAIWADNKQLKVAIDPVDDIDLLLIQISDVIYRRFLVSRLMLYYMRGTLPEIQNYLTWLFPQSGAVVTSNNDMTYEVGFTSPLNVEEAALYQLEAIYHDILPKICGVQSKDKIFGARRFAFWDKNPDEKPAYDPSESEEAIEGNYPYTYIEDDGTAGLEENEGHGTSY